MTLIKILLFILSTLGLWELMRCYFNKVDISFIPGITIAIQSSLLFIAGLLNILLEVTYLIYGIGLISIVLKIYKNKSIKFIRSYLNPSYVFLGLSLIVMGIFLKGKVFTHYDDFSHWALIVRRIVETNRFPNFTDTLIEYQEYPVGSAAFIFFVIKLTCGSESMQMLAQVYVMVASIIPLFSLSKKSWLLVAFVISSFTNYVLVYNTAVTSLLVDTLLPLVAMSGLLYTLLYCKHDAGKREIVPIVFYLIQIIQIKNSGLLFIAFISLAVLVNLIKGKNKAVRLSVVILPIVSFFLWHKHCQYVFDTSELSKHAMTSANYMKVFGSKSTKDIILIRDSLIEWVFSWKDSWLTIAIFLVTIVLAFFLNRKECRKALGLFFIAILLFITYQIGIYGMYLYSMPGGEATQLAGIERYEKTIVISMLYLSMIPIIDIISMDCSSKRIKALIASIVMVIMIFTQMGIIEGKILFAAKDIKATSSQRRNWVESVKKIIIYQIMILIPC